MLPPDIEQAARGSAEGFPPLTPTKPGGVAGEIAVAACSSQLKRLVCVLSREDDTQTLSIQLITNVVEAATDLDLIVRSKDSGLPFDALLQSELYGPIFVEQLEDARGSIPDAMREAASVALATDGESLFRFETGLPLGNLDDPRRGFKESELQDLEALVAECRRWLAGGRSDSRLIDPELLLPPAAGTSQEDAVDQFLELLDVLDRLPESDLQFPSELLVLFDESGLMDELFRWRSDFSMDVSRVMTRFRISEASGTLPDNDSSKPAVLGSHRKTDAVLERYVRSLAGASPSLDIETTDRCWGSDKRVLVLRTKDDRYCRVRPQLEAA